MSQGFSIAGLPVRAGLGWTLLIGAVTAALALRWFPSALPERSMPTSWLMAAVSAVMLLGSVLVHEVGHALVARQFGVRSGGITLLLLGARTEMAGALPHPRAEALMAAAGPAVNALLALVCAAVLSLDPVRGSEEIASMLTFAMLANALLAVINALPVFPLDGGRIVRAYFWLRTGQMDVATNRAAMIGLVSSALVTVAGAAMLAARVPLEGMLTLAVGIYLYARARSAFRRR